MVLELDEQRKHDVFVKIELCDDHYLLGTNGKATVGPLKATFASERYSINWSKGAESIQYVAAVYFPDPH